MVLLDDVVGCEDVAAEEVDDEEVGLGVSSAEQAVRASAMAVVVAAVRAKGGVTPPP